ncbi:MAG TPA: NADH-quinone oxidoreductase subunit L [Methanothrix sp.]|mgnify:FL=1|uniref:NADH-quinone oxidoreductase subunit L n=1 Tax=Methanothrix sp. TaxID=90426 RepID=UPI002C4E7725|nr:NADH-quinone oxidoreductase subunit L [Methanothrix sp.]MDI9417832.1 NADH-quinone oxidoreductase subunit L [Euryarchaeota archaeon]HON36322.1 NADH-quinone oxidoreductase subunit L [Methanothrix sp.]HRU75337.1 NADH-quinone oxidoreductase subunit L [Methanothrix sp.]
MYSELAYLIVGLPVLAFVLCLFFGWNLPRGGGFITVLATLGAFIISLGIFQEIYPGEIVHQSMRWFGEFNVGILIDPLSLVMLLMVSFVVTLIHIYGNGYMNGDPGAARYFAEAALFSAAMLGLVYADNLLQLFIFWELVGLCSYLLIGFWYRKPSAAAAAKKAFLTTRVGDVMFLAAIIILYNNLVNLNITLNPGEYLLQFPVIYAHIGQIPPDQLTLIALGLLGGAVGKSGQFPLHVWLPDAMEGPTTVSAMIHAATMVTAGVFLVARMFPLFYAAPHGLTAVAAVGAFTALFAATMGLAAFDIKRVLAFSTVSQLGFMMAGLGVGAAVGAFAVGVSMFHLIGHSFFKALLFLCAGSVIHAVNTNDLREMGGVGRYMKWTMYTMLIGSLSLAGFPYFTGFYSKDEIIMIAYEYGVAINFLPYIFLILAATLTAIYTFRMWFSVFTGKERSNYGKHESPWVMLGPLVILAVFAFAFGMASQHSFYDYLDSNFDHYEVDFGELGIIGGHALVEEHGAAAQAGEHTAEAGEGHALPIHIRLLPYIVALGGILIAALFYWDRIKRFEPDQVTGDNDPIRKMLLKGYYQHEIMTGWISEGIVYGTAILANIIDIKIVDGWLNWLSAWVMGFAGHVRKVQTGVVQNYVAALMLGIVVLVIAIAAIRLAMEVGLI